MYANCCGALVIPQCKVLKGHPSILRITSGMAVYTVTAQNAIEKNIYGPLLVSSYSMW